MNDKDRRRSSLIDELARIGLTPGAHNPPPAGNDATRSLAPPRAGQDAGALAWTRPTADSLTADNVLKPQRKRPASGWRKALYLASGGLVNPGPSAKELLRMELEARPDTDQGMSPRGRHQPQGRRQKDDYDGSLGGHVRFAQR